MDPFYKRFKSTNYHTINFLYEVDALIQSDPDKYGPIIAPHICEYVIAVARNFKSHVLPLVNKWIVTDVFTAKEDERLRRYFKLPFTKRAFTCYLLAPHERYIPYGITHKEEENDGSRNRRIQHWTKCALLR